MGKKENKKNNTEIKEDQLSIQDVNDEDKIESAAQEIESNENSDADYIHDESIMSDDEFKKKLKEQKYKDKIKQKEIYKQYKKDKKERKKINKEALKNIKEKEARREFKIQKHEEELNIRSELGVKTIGERFSLYLRKTVMHGSLQTFLLVLILICAYITINLYVQQAELPKIDVTTNKLYTISKESKEYIKTLEEDVRLYVYGIPENNYVCDLLKQYAAVSSHVTFEVLDGNSKPELLTKYNLTTNSSTKTIIVETDSANKQLSTSDLTSVDPVTGEAIDLAESAITNAIYSTISTNQPKVYYLAGHGNTFTMASYQQANSTLSDYGFVVDELNISKVDKIPSDCNLIIIPPISSDLLDKESDLIKAYINKGGNLLIMSAFNDKKSVSSFKNLKSIIDIYGATLDNSGIVLEQDETKTLLNSVYFVLPELSLESDITEPLYDYASSRKDNTYVTFYLPGRIELPSEEKQSKDKLTVTVLASSSESSIFAKDNKDTVGSNTLASMITKTIKEGQTEEETVKSSIILIADGAFCSDSTIPLNNYNYPIAKLGRNIDLYANSIAKLSNKEDFMSIRKTIFAPTFTPTNSEDHVVVLIIVLFPIFIIILGIVIKIHRSRKN